jgi:acyl carrier protein
MRERIKEVLSAVLDIPLDDLNDLSSSKTLDMWDSLNHMKIIAALEEEFDIELTEEESLQAQSVKLIEYILMQRKKNHHVDND